MKNLIITSILIFTISLNSFAETTNSAENLIVTIKKTSDWNTGHCAEVTIQNKSQENYNSWEISVKNPPELSSLWNAKFSDNKFKAESWNNTIKAGNKKSFGYCAKGPFVNPILTNSVITNPTAPVSTPTSTPISTTVPSNITLSFKTTSDWGSGHCASLTLENKETKKLENWKITTLLPQLTSNWGMKYSNKIITPDTWNDNLASNSQVSMGYCAKGKSTFPKEATIKTTNFEGSIKIIEIKTTNPVTPSTQPATTPNNTTNQNNQTTNENTDLSRLSIPTSVSIEDEIKLGNNVNLFVWGGNSIFKIPKPSWALSLVHAANLAHLSGLDKNYTYNSFLATAIKESHLNCEQPSFPNHDGCFQIEKGTAFTEMQRMYPEIFKNLTHTDTINNSFEKSALTKAYYDVFTVKMFDNKFKYKAGDFIKNSADPNALVKIVSLAYNRGHWWEQFKKLFIDSRDTCINKTNLLSCIDHDIAFDHSTAIVDYTNKLTNAPEFGGEYYDTALTWSDISDYLDTIKPIYPGINFDNLKTKVKSKFDELKDNSGKISFRYDASQIIKVILENTWQIPDPLISKWY